MIQQYVAAVAQEVERPSLESEGSRFDSRLLLAKCRSVLEQDTEPLTAPDEQVGALHDFLCHQCVNVKYIVKRFGEKRYINAVHLPFMEHELSITLLPALSSLFCLPDVQYALFQLLLLFNAVHYLLQFLLFVPDIITCSLHTPLVVLSESSVRSIAAFSVPTYNDGCR